MSFAIDGLISGLDTTNMINQLMQIEARPQAILENKVSATKTLVSALQQLNKQFASLGELAEKTGKPGALDLYTASTSSKNVTATTSASPGAAAGAIDIVVNKTAQSQVIVSSPMTAWPAESRIVSIAVGGGETVELTADSTSLDDIVSVINDADAGVSAMKVASGADTDGNPQYRLQISATDTGAAGGFTIHQGSVAGGTATNLMDAPDAVQISAAQDAEVTLWAGTTAAQTVSSSSNTFTDLLPGVDVAVTEASTDPVTVTVGRDDEGIAKTAKDLVNELAGLFSFISANSSVTTSTSTGVSTAKGGIFTGDSSVRSLEQRMLRAATGPVDGESPSSIGITITRDGTVEFDEEKFAAALEENPARVEHVVQEIASRVATLATDASDERSGSITLRIQGQESQLESLNDQISDWDRRLEMRRSTLEAKWANLEVTLSGLQSQGDWLSGQLGTLPGMGGSS